MKQQVMFLHCNERDEVVEIESYIEQNGAIISIKKSEPGSNRPVDEMRQELEAAGWQIELAGTVPLGYGRAEANSYVARHPLD